MFQDELSLFAITAKVDLVLQRNGEWKATGSIIAPSGLPVTLIGTDTTMMGAVHRCYVEALRFKQDLKHFKPRGGE